MSNLLGNHCRKSAKLAATAAPVAASMGAPQAAIALATVGAVGNLTGKGKTQKANRYRLAKKKTSNT